MFQNKRIILPISILTIILISLLAFSSLVKPKPQTIDLASPDAVEIQSVIERWYQFASYYVCHPETDISSLDAIMVDTLDYRPTARDLSTIEKVYGKKALTHAGYLTTQKAYYQLRQMAPAAPPPGVLPTQPPSYCRSTEPSGIDFHIQSIGLEKSDRAVVQYNYYGNTFEAILRQINGVWRIAGIKVIHWSAG